MERRNASPVQMEFLINFMDGNKPFATNKLNTRTGRMEYARTWGQLARDLNSLSGGFKSTEKWKITWRDLKANIKKKATRIHLLAVRTGGGPASGERLSELEERVMGIMGKGAILGREDLEETMTPITNEQLDDHLLDFSAQIAPRPTSLSTALSRTSFSSVTPPTHIPFAGPSTSSFENICISSPFTLAAPPASPPGPTPCTRHLPSSEKVPDPRLIELMEKQNQILSAHLEAYLNIRKELQKELNLKKDKEATRQEYRAKKLRLMEDKEAAKQEYRAKKLQLMEANIAVTQVKVEPY